MYMAKTQKITGKLKRILLLRVVALAALALLTVLATTLMLEHFMIKSALEQEAEYFWERYELDSSAQPPDTWNLKSLLIDNSGSSFGSKGSVIAGEYREAQSGFTQLKSQPGYNLLYKTERYDKQLLLLFNGENVRELAFFLGVIPLTLFLLLSYLIGFLFYRKAREALSPIMWLADKFGEFDPTAPNVTTINLAEMPANADWEATVLAKSLSEYTEQIKQFISRERAFTRDVSHELRTPLTVIGMAANLIETEGKLNQHDAKALQRIKNASKDMQELVEVFLSLARESEREIEESEVWIEEVIEHEIEQSKVLLEDKNVKVNVHKNYDLSLRSSAKILEILVGNLIRNAFNYTNKGSVNIYINEGSVEVRDTGVGMSEQQVEQVYKPFFRAGARPSGGHGVGLTIVKRISSRFNWPVEIVSKEGEGTAVTITFFKVK